MSDSQAEQATPVKLKFELGDKVAITCSDEEGEIIGLATYSHTAPQALVRYCNAEGRAVESWWTFDALHSIPFIGYHTD